MSPLLEELHDIEGIDPASWWPLAIGWWIILGILTIAIVFLVYRYIRLLSYRKSWKNDAFTHLCEMERNLNEQNSRKIAEELSEYIRRIAIKKHSRKECASLIDEEWLTWLTAHDPQKYEWKNKARFLINISYAPADRTPPLQQVQEVILAAKGWVQ